MTTTTRLLRLGTSLLAAGALALTLASCSTATDPAPTQSTSPSTETAAPAAPASVEGLRILLTNDDSVQASRENNSDGLGLYELRSALCDAGADVVVIGPWAVQSGRGTAVTNSGTMTLSTPLAIPADYADDCASAPSGGAVYGLCLGEECGADSLSATPVDTVKFALRGGLAATVGWDTADLVLTGPNAGMNVASSINDSGTVGAAISGVEHRIPAVAFSASADSTMGFYPVENYRAASTWAVEFLQGLRSQGLLDQHEFVINVNYPDVTRGEVGAARFVQVGTAALAFHSYVPTTGDTFDIALGLCEGSELCDEAREDADWQAVFSDNAIGVGAINPDRTYGAELAGTDALARLRQYVETSAPTPVS